MLHEQCRPFLSSSSTEHESKQSKIKEGIDCCPVSDVISPNLYSPYRFAIPESPKPLRYLILISVYLSEIVHIDEIAKAMADNMRHPSDDLEMPLLGGNPYLLRNFDYNI